MGFARKDLGTSRYFTCAEVTGAVKDGATITVKCAENTKGRFVVIKLPGKNQQLTLCEVQVFGEIGQT